MMVRGPDGDFCTSKGKGELLARPPVHSELLDLLGDPMDATPATEVTPGVRTEPVFPINKE